MKPLKKKYLDRIRNESAYPFLRSLLNITFSLCLFAAFVSLLLGIKAASQGERGFALPLFGASVGLALIGIITKESGIILLDIADSITDLNSRYEGQ